MDEGLYIGALVCALFFAVAGVRLLLLHSRTGLAPEFLLGSYCLLTGFSYGAWVIPSIDGFASLASICSVLSPLIYSIAVVPFLLFIRRVYRPDASWASVAVAVFTLLLFIANVGPVLDASSWHESVNNLWFWTYYLTYTLAIIWMTVETSIVYRAAKKRALIGLCSATVVNRYLLWALFGLASVLASGADLYVESTFTSNGVVSPLADITLSICENVSIAMLWLAFFPPKIYRDWIAKRDLTSKSGEA